MTPTPCSHGCAPTAQPSARYRKVLGMAPLWRARAAWLKGMSMGAFGVFVCGRGGFGHGLA